SEGRAAATSIMGAGTRFRRHRRRCRRSPTAKIANTTIATNRPRPIPALSQTRCSTCISGPSAGGSLIPMLPPPAYDNRSRGASWGGWLVAADLPDRAVAVLGHEERTVWRHRYADRPAPDLSLGGEEAGHEVLIGTGRLVAVVEGQPDDLVAGTDFAVPRAV